MPPDEPDAADPFDQSVEDAWVDLSWDGAGARAVPGGSLHRPAALGRPLRDVPDGHALLGRVEEIDNLYLANGSSGHGVMHAPALGQLLAEIMLDGAASTLDAHALRPSRFAEGESNLAPYAAMKYTDRSEGGGMEDPKTFVERV